MALAVVFAVAGAGTTSAMFTASAATPGATISAGTTGLTVSPSTFTLTNMYPGETRYQAVTVTNTGNSTVFVRLESLVRTSTSNVFAQNLTVGFGVVASAASCTTGFAPSWTGTLAVPNTPSPAGGALTAGQSATVCFTVAFAAAAPSSQNQSVAFTFTLGVV